MAEVRLPPNSGRGDTAGLIAAPTSRRGMAASIAAVGAAFLASLCCIGPLVFVAFGVGASLASHFEPLRPALSVLTIGLLTIGFHVVYSKRPARDVACDENEQCVVPHHARDRWLLWLATAITLAILTFPHWSVWFV